MTNRVRIQNQERYDRIREIGLEDLVLVLDVDGVLTDGTFTINHYGEKATKTFGPDDNDALKDLAGYGVEIWATSADTLGYSITKERLDHMGIPFFLSSQHERLSYIKEKIKAAHTDLCNVIYVGDGYYDWRIFEHVGLGVAPFGSFSKTEENADLYIYEVGGQRAIAELVRFFIEELR